MPSFPAHPPNPRLHQETRMQGDSDPTAPTEVRPVASHHHHHEHGLGSFSPSSSASSSPRVSSFVDHKVFDYPAGRRPEGSASTPTVAGTSLKSPAFSASATAPDTDEGWSCFRRCFCKPGMVPIEAIFALGLTKPWSTVQAGSHLILLFQCLRQVDSFAPSSDR